MPLTSDFITLADLYIAYRKSKKEAYTDTNCAHGLKFAEYENNLDTNLRRLQGRLLEIEPDWPTQIKFIGRATCIAKSVKTEKSSPDHFAESDLFKSWRKKHRSRKADADFRPVIDATVDFQVVSALWILKVGHLFDACLDSRWAVGNRLYRRRAPRNHPLGSVGEINTSRHELFSPYFRAYRQWREAGFAAMKSELSKDRSIVAVTMDLKRFYHQVDCSFLINNEYLRKLGITLTSVERQFTQQLIAAIGTWNKVAGQKLGHPQRGLPVGLTASSLIANVLLQEFDSRVIEKIGPIHYGRYVDDIFLVLADVGLFEDRDELMRWLASKLGTMARYRPTGPRREAPILQIRLKYSPGSKLEFAGDKQKVFRLADQQGVDLITPIEEHIRKQNSEFRTLPDLPDREAEMAARALLVSSDATLDADALRKADAVTLRRAGFARLLSTVEMHTQDLDTKEWTVPRFNFYGLAQRHLLTPLGFFDYLRYLPRILTVMAACDDLSQAYGFIRKLGRLVKLLNETCSFHPNEMRECTYTLAMRLTEAVFKTRRHDRKRGRIMPLLKLIQQKLAPKLQIPKDEEAALAIGEILFGADWSRRPYGPSWLESRIRARISPSKPEKFIAERIGMRAIDELVGAAGIKRKPHWPALCFPTRPVTVAQLVMYAPRLLEDYNQLHRVIFGLRGSWLPLSSRLTLRRDAAGNSDFIAVPDRTRKQVLVAVTNLETTPGQWASATKRKPDLGLIRYRRINGLINDILRQRPRPHYVVFPECSLPRRWAKRVAHKLSLNGISLLAGLEYRQKGKSDVLNEALVSLTTNFGGYPTNICFLQPKLKPAWKEKLELMTVGKKKMASPQPNSLTLPVYQHAGFFFSLLICSDLTTLENRLNLQGKIDCLFVPEWNPDVETFSTLMEASAHDLHAYMVQANNRLYGDSRIRAPYKINHRRDVVRVRGGLNDYFVIGEVDYTALRKFQYHPFPPAGDSEKYKPFPVDFKMSDERKQAVERSR